MADITLAGYYLTLASIRERVKRIIKEDEDINDLVDQRINDALQAICWDILPRPLIAPPETVNWTNRIQTLPDRVMRIMSLTVPSENRRKVEETTPTDILQNLTSESVETRMPYYFARLGRNAGSTVTTITADEVQSESILFDSIPDGSDMEVMFIYEHPLLEDDNHVILLDPPYHSLVVDGALLELAEYTGESVADFEKRQSRFEFRLRKAKKRMNDEFGKMVIMGVGGSFIPDRIGTIPTPSSPRFM